MIALSFLESGLYLSLNPTIAVTSGVFDVGMRLFLIALALLGVAHNLSFDASRFKTCDQPEHLWTAGAIIGDVQQ